MAMNDNLVQKMDFQILIDQDSHFNFLTKEIPDIVSQHLENIIDRCLKELKLENQFFIIDRLEIDLGQLDLANFKNDLVDKFKAQFFKEIQKQIGEKSFNKIPDEELTYIIFLFFIKNGGRPWWLNNQVRHFGEFAEKAFALLPQKFIQHCKLFMRRPIYRKRIIENLPEDLLVRALTFDKRLSTNNPSNALYAIKEFFKQRYRHWNGNKISLAFKEVVLQLFLYPHKIDQPWKLNLAIVETIQNTHSEIVNFNGLNNEFLKYDVPLPRSNSDALNLTEKNSSVPSAKRDHLLIQGFQFYMENGYSKPGKIANYYKYHDINTLFRYLIANHLGEITALLLSLGRSSPIKKRFLGSILQEHLDEFFALVAPSKRKLFHWVDGVFKKVQEEYKPINQTFINVKKSINEITFELFLNKKLTSTNDENYLRFLFKQTARKFGIKYKDLLFFTIKALSNGDKRTSTYKFHQTLTAIYKKDILKNRLDFSVEQAEIGIYNPEERTGMNDYRNKDFIHNLFLSLYKQKQRSNESQVSDWLKTKLEVISMESTSDILSLWEVFAAKFALTPEQLLIPVLVEKHRNPSIRLSSESFDFWKNKYKLSGLYSQKKPDDIRLIQVLHDNKKWIPKSTIKGILLGMKLGARVEKLDFELVSTLIHTPVSPIIPLYFTWLDKILREGQLQTKKRTVYNWFLHQLIVLPKNELTLLFFQKKTLEFLQLDEELTADPKQPTGRKNLLKNERNELGKTHHPDFQQMALKSYPQQSTQALFRIIEILGRSSVLGIFPDSKKFGYKILFQILTTKYETEFLNLLKTHQFNKELRDYILVQAPGWLKKDLLNFINKSSLNPWNPTISSLKEYYEKTNWIKLKDSYLSDFIEKVLWGEIFEPTAHSFGDMIALIMQQALVEKLVTQKFWSDYYEFKSLGYSGILPRESSLVNEISALEGTDFLSYAEAFSKSKVKSAASKQILESILFDFNFPVGHSFEEYPVEEFKSYINKLIIGDKKVLIELLTKVDSPLLLERFLTLLDDSTLRFLIQEKHKKLGFPGLFKKIEAIFSFYKIKDKTKIKDFFSTWIGALYFETPSYIRLPSLYAHALELMVTEDVLAMSTIVSKNDWKPLLAILQLEEKEGELFFEELGWSDKEQERAEGFELTGKITGDFISESDFKAYIADLKPENKKVLIGLLEGVESPVLLLRLVKMLDEDTL